MGGGEGGVAPHILNLGARDEWSASCPEEGVKVTIELEAGLPSELV